jgi:hypothetical protein
VATLAAFPVMLEREASRSPGLSCRWLVGVSVREYRELEAGDRFPDSGTYERMCKLYGWTQTFVGRP